MAKVEEPAQPGTDLDEPRSLGGDWPADPLSGFPAEAELTAAAARAKARRRLVYGGGAALLVILTAGAFIAPRVWSALERAPETGTLTVVSAPAGVQVSEAGRDLGATPLTVPMPPGAHTLTLRRGDVERALAVDVKPGSTIVHHVEMSEAPRTGSLRVESLPPGATVEVDGTSRGETPVTVETLEPGEHDVTVSGGTAVFSQRVTVVAGGAVSLVVPLGRPEVGAGWVTVSAPIELQVYEGESLVGNSRMDRIMLRAGRHMVRFVNAETEFETTARLQVEAGAGTHLPVKVPNGRLSVNAVPWAEVFVDGQRIGETPIANVPVRIGSHELVLRHPSYAEQRRTVVVSVTTPARIGVDLRQ